MRQFLLKTQVTMDTVMAAWAMHRAFPPASKSAEAEHALRNRLKEDYFASMQAMAELVLDHHTELPDGHLVRLIRLFVDLPIETDDFEDRFPSAYERFRKWQYKEPGYTEPDTDCAEDGERPELSL